MTTAEHGDLCDDVDGARGGAADLHAVQVYGVITDVQPVSDRLPALTPVTAGQQAADFDGGIHILGIRGVGGDADDALPQRRHVAGDVGEDDPLGVHRLPMLAPILGAVD